MRRPNPLRREVLAIVWLLAGATPGLAAEATAEEAKRLVDVFHAYLGAPGPGEADRVSATPEGDAYRLSIDFDAIAEAFLMEGFSVDAPELSFLAEPLPDATWRISELTLPTPLTFGIPGQDIAYRWEGATFEGIYDPALRAFLTFNHTIASTSSEMRGVEGASTSFIGEQVVTGTTTSDGDGTVSTQIRQSVRDIVVQETIALPDSGLKQPDSQPIEFAYSIEAADIDLDLDGFDAVGLLDLWAYAVAGIQGSGTVDQDELKGMLQKLLPLFNKLDESVLLSGLRVGTPLGDFGMEQARMAMTLPGLVGDGGMAFSIALGGPAYPAELVPAWAGELAPTGLDLGFDISGFNLDAPAQHLLAAFDAEQTPPIGNADWMTAAMLALPGGGATLTLRPSRIDGPVLDVAFEGQMRLSMPTPTGTFKVTASGLDAAIAALSAASAEDPMAVQALGLLSIAQMWGRTTDGGAMEFVIALNPDGSITVNDQMVKPPAGKPT